jgi:hypothetical protein
MQSGITVQKAYPNGTCYCGCNTPLEDRTAFWVRGHDGIATHQVIRDHYGTVADFVLAHRDQGLMRLTLRVARLEETVFPNGRENGPLFTHRRSSEQWRMMRQLVQEIEAEGVPPTCPGAWSVVALAKGLIKDKKEQDEALAESGRKALEVMLPQQGDDPGA